MILSFLPEIGLLFMLIFARVGTMMMLMPGLGERSISTRVRLSIALALTLAVYPMAAPLYQTGVPQTLSGLLLLFAREFAIAFAIGLSARIAFSALQVAGATISMQIGLAQAVAFDPSAGGQGTTLGNFLSLVAITLIFVLDVHHLSIAAIHDSFMIFPPGAWFPAGDVANAAVMIIASSFEIGLKLSMPFLVFGLLFNLSLGIINRMMPQVQIFFISQPLSISLGMILLMVLLSTMMMWYMDYLATMLGQFTLNGS